jgi:hypothetical protein
MKQSIALTAVFAPLLFPADFWEKKKHSEWSEKETLKILQDSPWAASVNSAPRSRGGPARNGGFDASRGGAPGRAGDSPPNGASNGNRAPAGGGLGRGGRRGGFGGGRGIVPVPSLTMLWHSAKPVRQAVANLRVADGGEPSPEAASETVARPQHVLGIYGLPVTVAQMRPEQLSRAVSITTKQDRTIRPASVYLDRGRKGGPEPGLPGPRVGYTLYVFFPRGDESIRIEDKEIEVLFQLGRAEYRKKFKLEKMIFDGKLEL